MEILWKRTVFAEFWANHPKLRGNCAFPQNLHTRKLGEITVFCAGQDKYWRNSDDVDHKLICGISTDVRLLLAWKIFKNCRKYQLRYVLCVYGSQITDMPNTLSVTTLPKRQVYLVNFKVPEQLFETCYRSQMSTKI